MGLSPEDRQWISSQLEVTARGITMRQDDMLAQQRITNGRVLALEQRVAAHEVSLSDTRQEVDRHRTTLHQHATVMQAHTSTLDGLALLRERALTPEDARSLDGMVLTVGRVKSLWWLVLFLLAATVLVIGYLAKK